MKRSINIKRLLQYFIQGILVLAPITITSYLIYWMFINIDNLLVPFYRTFSSNPQKPLYIPGLGFIIIICVVILVGYLSSFFLIGRFLSFFDHWMEKTPGVKIIYSFIKDFSEAFAGKKRKFKKAVLVSIFQEDVWQIGFITNEDLSQFGMQAHISVYIPQSYAIAGQLFLVKRDRIKPLNTVASDALKFAISGGVVEVEE